MIIYEITQPDVASFTDAWIETLITKGLVLTFLSHLLQMRGLKLMVYNWLITIKCRIFYRCVD